MTEVAIVCQKPRRCGFQATKSNWDMETACPSEASSPALMRRMATSLSRPAPATPVDAAISALNSVETKLDDMRGAIDYGFGNVIDEVYQQVGSATMTTRSDPDGRCTDAALLSAIAEALFTSTALSTARRISSAILNVRLEYPRTIGAWQLDVRKRAVLAKPFPQKILVLPFLSSSAALSSRSFSIHSRSRHQAQPRAPATAHLTT